MKNKHSKFFEVAEQVASGLDEMIENRDNYSQEEIEEVVEALDKLIKKYYKLTSKKKALQKA